MTDQRIKLAEFVGRQHCPNANCGNAGMYPVMPDGEPEQCEWCNCHPDSIYSFDPRNDANECDALIRKLNKLGASINVTFSGNRGPDSVQAFYKYFKRVKCDDWKHGVCDLAEKVIDDETK